MKNDHTKGSNYEHKAVQSVKFLQSLLPYTLISVAVVETVIGRIASETRRAQSKLVSFFLVPFSINVVIS